MNKLLYVFILTIVLTGLVMAQSAKEKIMNKDTKQVETATFGSGCFWCTEAVFERVKGVIDVVSGYAGGDVENPTYEQVCAGSTNHAEVVQVTYDPSIISYDELLEIFWKTHDPTTLNRQGADVGTQYRSIILYHNDEQRKKAEYYKQKLEQEKVFRDPIVTQIEPFTKFYQAEAYHQDYFRNNPRKAYCSFVIQPKINKFEKIFKEKLKNN